jgi:hypothetical protein
LPRSRSLFERLRSLPGQLYDQIVATDAFYAGAVDGGTAVTGTVRTEPSSGIHHPYMGAVTYGGVPELSWCATSTDRAFKRVWLEPDVGAPVELPVPSADPAGCSVIRDVPAVSTGVWTFYAEPAQGETLSATFFVEPEARRPSSLCTTAAGLKDPVDIRLCQVAEYESQARYWDMEAGLLELGRSPDPGVAAEAEALLGVLRHAYGRDPVARGDAR